MTLREQAAQARVKLEVIQEIPWHSQIGTVIMVKGEPLVIENQVQYWKTAHICPKCPSKKACKQASVALAILETKIIEA